MLHCVCRLAEGQDVYLSSLNESVVTTSIQIPSVKHT